MRKNYFFKPLITALIFLGLYSCSNVDKLSDENTVIDFEITSYSPEAIELGEPEITVEEGEDVILIPVKYGEDRFPLTFDVAVEFSGRIDMVAGLDLSKTLTLEDMDDKLQFLVVAESGLARRYTIKPVIVEYNVVESMLFEVISVNEGNELVFQEARIIDEVMTIYVVDLKYPFRIVPEFEIDIQSTGFEGFVNGTTEFVFNSAEDSKNIVIVDKTNASKRDIKVVSKSIPLVSGADGENEPTKLINSDLTIKNTNDSQNFTVDGFRITNQRDSITIFISPISEPLPGEPFPANIQVEIAELGAESTLMGIENSQIVHFDDFGKPVGFYLIDWGEEVARNWKMYTYKNEEPVVWRADVVSFGFDYDVYKLGLISYGTLDRENVTIDADRAEIWLNLTSYRTTTLATWFLQLKSLNVGYSAGAGAELPTFRWEGNGSWQEPRPFTVVSSETGESKEWTVNIRYYPSDYMPSTECELEQADLVSLLPFMAQAESTNPVIIDNDTNDIYVRLAEDDGAYPLRVKLDYMVSRFATAVPQNTDADGYFVFDSSTAENSVTIVAEDGTTTKDWTVKLVTPNRSTGVDVTVFNINSFSSRYFKLDAININNELGVDEGEIVVTLLQSGSCPMTMDYSMSLSRRATADIPLVGKFQFRNLNDTHTFTVTGSDDTQKTWTLRIAEYTPQLENWNMENWSGNEPLPMGVRGTPYWATANNKYTTGAVRGNGASGEGYAAQLTTDTALSKITSGSLFLGWFDKDNITAGLSDPVILTFFGIEFSASKKIAAIEVDINYTSGNEIDDHASVGVQFIKHDPAKGAYVFHGNKPGSTTPHPDNTATSVSHTLYVAGHKPGTVDGINVTVVPKGQWTTLRVNIDYKGHDPFDFTHFAITSASSAQGDNFIGSKGSRLLLDNFKIIYE